MPDPIPDESILREQVRAVIRDGKLPKRRPDRTWGNATKLLRARGYGRACRPALIRLTEAAWRE